MALFTRDELSDHVSPPGSPEDMPLMEVAEFHAHQFKNPISNQSLVAHCGSKEDFSSALWFWLWSLQMITGATIGQGVYRRAARDTLCEPLTGKQYFELMDYYVAGLKRPPDFLLRQNLVAAMKMFGGVAMGDARLSVLAEFDDVYIAVHDRIGL